MMFHIPSLIDKKVGSWIEKIPESSRPSLLWLSTVTHPVVWAVVLVGGSFVCFSVGNASLGLLWIAAAAVLPLEQILKVIFRRPRPLTMYVEAMKFRSYSFPSGHAYASVLFFSLLTVTVQSTVGGIAGNIVGAVASILVVLIGVSRVYLGAHFPTDVIAGWAIGLLVIFAYAFMRLTAM